MNLPLFRLDWVFAILDNFSSAAFLICACCLAGRSISTPLSNPRRFALSKALLSGVIEANCSFRFNPL